MQSPWINRLGNWNPQLLREYRGRLKPRSAIASVAISAIAQVLLLLIFWQENRVPQEKWLYVWRSITWILPYILFTIGSYYLASDLTQEERRGTLNFIRLSPRPAWEILLGKLLGVPALLYLTVGLAIPLHFVAALGAGVSLPLMLSVYVLLLIGCIFCYSAAMLYGLVGSTQRGLANRQATAAVSFAAIAFLFLAPLFMSWNIGVTWRPFSDFPEIFGDPGRTFSWFYFPLNNQIWLSHGFTLANLGISIYLVWRMLLRRFRQPRSTVISKRQSYAILAYLEVLVLGFVLQPDSLSSGYNASWPAFFMYGFTFLLLLILMFGVCPQRQALLDWVQYQPQGWQSLIWADKSPAILAIFIQLAIANALLLPWSLVAGIGSQQPLETAIAFVAVTNILLISGIFIQQVFASKIRNPIIWATGGLSVWLIVLPMLLGLLSLFPDVIPATTALWAFLGYPFWHFTKPNNLPFTILGIVAQWLLLAFLLWRFQQTLRRLRAGSQS